MPRVIGKILADSQMYVSVNDDDVSHSPWNSRTLPYTRICEKAGITVFGFGFIAITCLLCDSILCTGEFKDDCVANKENRK